MGVDFYGVLGLKRSCTELEVKQAFRRRALRLHPDRARLQTPLHFEHQVAGPRGARRGETEDPDDDVLQFRVAARAYEVLVNPVSRAAFDLLGEAGLPPYDGDPFRTFRRFFGTDNPFLAQLRDRVQVSLEEPAPSETLVLPLRVTLREISEGTLKRCEAAVRIPGPGPDPGADGEGAVHRVREFTVNIRPGAAAGTEYSFPRAGHQDVGRPPGDVVFVLEEAPHPTLTREGVDLVQQVAVPLRSALTGCTLTAETLDGRIIRVAITDIVVPGYEKRIVGEGLPSPPADDADPFADDDTLRGDLVLRLSVDFPRTLSRQSRALLDQALQLAEVPDHTLKSGPAVAERTRAHGSTSTGGVARAILEEKMRKEAQQSPGGAQRRAQPARTK